MTSRAAALRWWPNLSLYDRAGRLARSRRGLTIAFIWGVLEAIMSPIVPDYIVAVLSAAAPERFALLTVSATAGSLAGGAVAFSIGWLGAGGEFLAHVPLVTARMDEQARTWLDAGGSWGLMRQPLSGIPYKVFGLQAAPAHVGLGPFLAASLVARGLRLGVVASLFAAGGRLARPWLPRVFGFFLLVYTIAFTFGLARVVEAWK